MKIPLAPVLLALVAATACSSAPDRQWMKAGPYTVEEFQRDTTACTHDGELDADCMQAKGWIAVQSEARPEGAKKSARPSYRLQDVR